MLPKSLPRGIWMLGFVSLFMDVSSEMIHAILPLFVVGTLGASAKLVASGNSVAALLGTSNGEVSAVISRGTVSKFVLEAAGLNIANAVLTKVFGDTQVQMNCMVANLDVKQGIARPRVFVLDTQDATINVCGAINLQGERYDLTLHPQSKGLRILSLRSPLYVRGSFADPDVGIDKRSVAMKARPVGERSRFKSPSVHTTTTTRHRK